jgi:hypothetical protein
MRCVIHRLDNSPDNVGHWRSSETPTGFIATAVSASEIDLTWMDNATNVTGYEIDRSPVAPGRS